MSRVASITFALVLACGGAPSPPGPTKASESKATMVRNPPRVPRDPNNPLRRPDRDKPLPRSEPQIPAADIESALTAALAARAADDLYTAATALRACANKIPKHTRCEGELAMILLDTPSHEAEARYYLEQTAADDDPTADADFFRRLSAALQRAGLWLDASVATRRMIARLPEPNAADYVALANLLQGVPKREAEAAEALHRAFELDPAQLDYLRDEALLLAQVPERRAEALERLQRYYDSVRASEPEKAEAVARQIESLRYDLQREAEPSPAKGPRAPSEDPPG